MKKTFVALAVLSSVAGAASAQSSVTLFGVADVGVAFIKSNGVSQDHLISGGNATSRFGLRGAEDLGGGLKANFWLESQVNFDGGTATADKFWNRRATVGLSGDFGEIRLGRDKTSTRNLIDDFDAFSGTGMGDITANQKFASSTLGAPGTIGNNRNDNEVRYFLPSNLGGVYGSAEFGYGENVNGQKYYGGRLGYKEGPLNITAAVGIATLFSSAKWGHGAVGASYDFGVAKIGVLGIETKYLGRKQDVYGINAFVPMGQGVFKLQYAQSNANTAAEAAKVAYDARMISAAYVYNMSKRTQLYGIVSDIDNKGAGTIALSISGAGFPATTTAGGTSSGFTVGMTHQF